MRRSLAVALALLLVCRWTQAQDPQGPRTVLIIRHAEKPGDAGSDDDDDAAANANPDLSTRGRERAAALAYHLPDRFGRPDFTIATRRSDKSDRPVETITPPSIRRPSSSRRRPVRASRIRP